MSLLPKSLHTVTVLVRVARHLEETATTTTVPPQTWENRVRAACRVLGLDDKFDQYGLIDAALKQLEAR